MDWRQGDALAMPFDDSEFAAVTCGYGLRNVADIPKALSEMHRVLKPGGKIAVLDFNNSSFEPINALQGFLLDNLVRRHPLRSCRHPSPLKRSCSPRALARPALLTRRHRYPRCFQVVPVARANGVAAEYEYLRPSIARFPRGQQQARLSPGAAPAAHCASSGGLSLRRDDGGLHDALCGPGCAG